MAKETSRSAIVAIALGERAATAPQKGELVMGANEASRSAIVAIALGERAATAPGPRPIVGNPWPVVLVVRAGSMVEFCAFLVCCVSLRRSSCLCSRLRFRSTFLAAI